MSKYWGDERHSDAIYAVYLKKVRYVPPQQFEGLPHYRPIDPDSHHLAAEIDAPDHLQWETLRERVIKAGTLDKLVESLINVEDNRMDSRQFNVFFATFRAFATPEAVLDKFITWYEANVAQLAATKNGTPAAESSHCASTSASTASPKSVQTLLGTLRSILICWLDMYPEDFYSAPADASSASNEGNSAIKFALLTRLIDFARSRALYDLKHKARKLRERFKRIAEEGGLAAQIPSIARYSYANTVCYDPHDLGYARHRAQMFDISRDNCVQIAEQLTFWDAVLFRELRPYQCQGAIWGKRHKTKADSVYSVRATIDQFNAVSQRVMTSIVFPECPCEFRAKIIEKWIDIARELRALKNFSSLKAVLSSLQSEPVFRLKSTWAVISKISMSHFKELATIFDADENGDESRARSILEAEGTAKNSPQKRPPATRRTKSDVNLAESQGTVPFLGSFLTDLTMLDQAHFDQTPEGLINFEKRRREFEILAKIRLFQSAARAYGMPMDQAFCIWFYYLPSINENECFTRSLEVEPISTSTPDTRRRAAKGSGNGAFNGLYSSPASSVSKFHSLTKMFTGVTANDSSNLGAVQSANSSPQHQLNSSSAATAANHYISNYSNHQQQPTSSFVGQRSNDSGILTEESTCSNAATANNHSGSKVEKCADSCDVGVLGLPRINADHIASSSSTSSLSRATGANIQFKQHSNQNCSRKFSNGRETPTPKPSVGLNVSDDYSGSEFNPYLHFATPSVATLAPPPAASRHAFSDTCFASNFSDFSESNQPKSRNSTPTGRGYRIVDDSIEPQKNSKPTDSCNCDGGREDREADSGEMMSVGICPYPGGPPSANTSPSPLLGTSGGGSGHSGKNYLMKQSHFNNYSSHHYSPSGSPQLLNVANGRPPLPQPAMPQSSHQKSNSSSSSCSSSLGGSAHDRSARSSSAGGLPGGLPPHPPTAKDFHLARVGLDDSLLSELRNNINYKCIKVENGDRMATLVERALEKHMMDSSERANVYLVQLLPDGSEFKLPDHCNPFYAVAPDPTSPMLNFLLKKRAIPTLGESTPTDFVALGSAADASIVASSAKKLNKEKRSNLLRWSSGYL